MWAVYPKAGSLPWKSSSSALDSPGSWSMDTNDVLRDYAYYYEYDERGRCIKKKLPGAEHILYEYDTRDRMTFSQDGVQRTSGKWTFYVYDNLNRPVQQCEPQVEQWQHCNSGKLYLRQ